jgi:hypothetical protein
MPMLKNTDFQIEEFIREYLEKNTSADVLNTDFHDQFSERFGGSRIPKYWGAMPNKKAMRYLKKLYNQGVLSRGIVSIPEHEIGMPNWVYSYFLKSR